MQHNSPATSNLYEPDNSEPALPRTNLDDGTYTLADFVGCALRLEMAEEAAR